MWVWISDTRGRDVRAVIFGAGATGMRVARIFVDDARFDTIEVRDTSFTRRSETVAEFGSRVLVGDGMDIDDNTNVVVIATPVGTQTALARRSIQSGAHVVTTTNGIIETRTLLETHAEAQYRRVSLFVGAGFMPGFTCLLARLGATELDYVDEIHVAKTGTGGPACAYQHHRALGRSALDWRDGRWTRRTGGSGRELCWFPEPVAGQDCYRGAMPDALLLVPEFPGVDRVTARMAATRRDRFTSWLPMMRRPHPEGLQGAVRVEVRGRLGNSNRVIVLGAHHPPARAAAVVAASSALHILEHPTSAGNKGLAGVVKPMELLRAIAKRGLRPERFEGATTFA